MPTIVTRDQWGSKSKWKYGNMKLPATGIVLHHSVTPTTDFPYQDTKRIEQEGIARFGQMSYSYVVHLNGTILEGAGTKTGAHTAGQNSTSFGICLIGDYDDAPGPDIALTPTPAQIEAVQWLIHHLKHEKNWLKDEALPTPHLAVKATACPGNKTMPLLAEFRKPWTPPLPPHPPGFVVISTSEVDMFVSSIQLNVQIDSNGNGWTRVPYSIDKVLSVLPHSGTRPGVDGAYDDVPDQVGVTPDEGGTVVVVRGGNPGGVSPVWLQVNTTPEPVALAVGVADDSH